MGKNARETDRLAESSFSPSPTACDERFEPCGHKRPAPCHSQRLHDALDCLHSRPRFRSTCEHPCPQATSQSTTWSHPADTSTTNLVCHKTLGRYSLSRLAKHGYVGAARCSIEDRAPGPIQGRLWEREPNLPTVYIGQDINSNVKAIESSLYYVPTGRDAGYATACLSAVS